MNHEGRRYVLVGASRGIGAAVAEHLVSRGAELVGVSRTPAASGTWIEADVATSSGIDAVVNAVSGSVLDALLFLGGIWEEGAFTDEYRFLASTEAEIRRVIETNLVAPILLSQRLVPALSMSANPRIVLLGSLSGLPNLATPEVANTASKFGLQGAAQAMSLCFGMHAIGVSVLNPGNVATLEVEQDIAEGRFAEQVPIAMADVVAALDYLLSASPDSVPFELNLAQKHAG